MRSVFVLIACALPAVARADDEADEVTVRARVPSPSETVVGHAEIERTGGISLADALRPQSDVDLQGGGAAGSTGRLSLRGSSPEETLLVIDGLRMSSRSSAALVAGADPNLIPASLLQRVSILRGPLSAVWGANAVAGVVELTTREPVAPRAFTGSLQYSAYLSGQDTSTPTDGGSDGVSPFYALRGQLTAAVRDRGRYFVAGLNASYTRGWAPNTRASLLDGSVKVGRALPGGGTAYVWLRAFDSYTGAPSWGTLLGSDAFDTDDRQARRGVQAVGVVRRPMGPRETLEASASLSVAHTTLYNPDADVTAGTDATEAQQQASEAQGRVAYTREGVGSFGTFTLGADFGRESMVTQGLGDVSAARGGLFVRDQRVFGPVTVDLAARLDGDTLYGYFVSPRAAVRVSSRDELVRAEASVGRGFRPPTFGERTWPTFVYAAPLHGAVGERGNPNVAVERAWGVDASLALGGGARRWQTSLRAFGLRTDGLIRWALDGDRFWTPTNVDGVWSAGATLDASVRVHPRVTLVGSAFWQTTRDENGDEVQGRLRSKATGRVVWYGRRGLRAWAEALWFDRSGVDARGEPWRGVFVNARVGWQFASGVGVFALGENLLDTRFESLRGLPTPGRVVWLGLALDIDED